MKRWRLERFGSPEAVLTLEDVELPAPSPGQIALKVAAAGLSLPDLLMIKGKHPLIPKPPFAPGLEVSGEVIAIGYGTPFKIGDRVMARASYREGWGGLAEYCLADASKTALAPSVLSDAEAAGFLISYRTAYDALVLRMFVKEDEVLLVLGAAGSSGATAIQLGKALGARVIAVASSQVKLDFCKSMGADEGLNYKSGDITQKVMELTRGKGADVIFDPVGGSVANQAISSIARYGRFGLVGYASGSWVQLDALQIVLRTYSVVGIFTANLTPEELERTHSDLIRLAEARRIRTPIGKILPFDQVPEALLELEKGELAGKIIIQVR